MAPAFLWLLIYMRTAYTYSETAWDRDCVRSRVRGIETDTDSAILRPIWLEQRWFVDALYFLDLIKLSFLQRTCLYMCICINLLAGATSSMLDFSPIWKISQRVLTKSERLHKNLLISVCDFFARKWCLYILCTNSLKIRNARLTKVLKWDERNNIKMTHRPDNAAVSIFCLLLKSSQYTQLLLCVTDPVKSNPWGKG